MTIDYLESLQCNTPAEGRALAFTLARKTIAAIQTDPEVRKKLRPQICRRHGTINSIFSSGGY